MEKKIDKQMKTTTDKNKKTPTAPKTPSIYAEAKPYLLLTGGLLSFLFVQTNWERFNPFSGSSKEVVSSSASTDVREPKSVATTQNPHQAPNKSKMERLQGFFGGGKSKEDGKEVHWGYADNNGPDKWGDLSTAYGSCKTGKAQSPVALVSGILHNGFQPLFYYKTVKGKIVNTGHSLQVNVSAGSFLRIVGKDYHLKQFHFHTKAEHKIDGRQYPMSVHLVHESDEGHIVVVAILLEPGMNDEEYNMLIDRLPLPQVVGTEIEIKGMDVNPAQMLPARYNRQYFTYDGSLTTPPCTENIGWIVMKTTVRTTMGRINRMKQIMKENFRPIQKLKGRSVMFGH